MDIHADPNTAIIVKSDTCGRVRYTAQYKHEVLASWRSWHLNPRRARNASL